MNAAGSSRWRGAPLLEVVRGSDGTRRPLPGAIQGLPAGFQSDEALVHLVLLLEVRRETKAVTEGAVDGAAGDPVGLFQVVAVQVVSNRGQPVPAHRRQRERGARSCPPRRDEVRDGLTPTSIPFPFDSCQSRLESQQLHRRSVECRELEGGCLGASSADGGAIWKRRRGSRPLARACAGPSAPPRQVSASAPRTPTLVFDPARARAWSDPPGRAAFRGTGLISSESRPVRIRGSPRRRLCRDRERRRRRGSGRGRAAPPCSHLARLPGQ